VAVRIDMRSKNPSCLTVVSPLVAFHCYQGDVKEQEKFQAAFPEKEIYHTGKHALSTEPKKCSWFKSECSGREYLFV
jgi:O-glycosyl hydrolase